MGSAPSQEDCFGIGKASKYILASVNNDFSCFVFIEFPLGCKTFNGPNPPLCYISLWMNSNCSEEGFRYPNNASMKQISAWNNMNLL